MSAAPVSVNTDEAARLTGLSRRTIQRAVKSGELIAHYPTSRPVIRLDDLNRWVSSAPTARSASQPGRPNGSATRPAIGFVPSSPAPAAEDQKSVIALGVSMGAGRPRSGASTVSPCPAQGRLVTAALPFLARVSNPAHPDGCWCSDCVHEVGPLAAVLRPEAVAT